MVVHDQRTSVSGYRIVEFPPLSDSRQTPAPRGRTARPVLDIRTIIECGEIHKRRVQRRDELVFICVRELFFDMQRFDFEELFLSMGFAVRPPDQLIPIENRQAEIAESSFRLRDVTLDLIVELKHVLAALPLNHNVIEG
jgi:hypothetical protein